MRKIGSRTERPITFSASGALLLEGARFNDEIHRLPTGQTTCMPKGVFFFQTHPEANQHQDECLASEDCVGTQAQALICIAGRCAERTL